MKNPAELIAHENPKIQKNIDRYLDESILDELEKEGFFKKLSGS